MRPRVETLEVLLLAPPDYHSESLVEEFSRAGVETQIEHISTMAELTSSLLIGDWNLILVSPWPDIDTEGAMNLVTRTGFQTPFLILPSPEEAGGAVARLLAARGQAGAGMAGGAADAARSAGAAAAKPGGLAGGPGGSAVPALGEDLAECLQRIGEALRRVAGSCVDFACLTPSEPLRVLAAPGEVELALLLLVLNARQALPRGGRLLIEARRATPDEAGGTGGIQAALLAAEGCAVLSVSDTGVGMDAETAARAFEPCFSAWPDVRRAGLGLAQIRALLESRGGRVSLESEPGRGSIARLYWPVTRG